MSFNIGKVASGYAQTFEGTKFRPRSLGQDGLLPNDTTEALMMIPALNLEAETQLAKQGLVNEGALDRQQLISDTYLKLDEMKAEREKNKVIADILFAGSDNVVGVSNNLLNSGLQTQIQKGVLANSPSNPTLAIPPKGSDVTGIKSNQLKLSEEIDLSKYKLTDKQKLELYQILEQAV